MSPESHTPFSCVLGERLIHDILFEVDGISELQISTATANYAKLPKFVQSELYNAFGEFRGELDPMLPERPLKIEVFIYSHAGIQFEASLIHAELNEDQIQAVYDNLAPTASTE